MHSSKFVLSCYCWPLALPTLPSSGHLPAHAVGAFFFNTIFHGIIYSFQRVSWMARCRIGSPTDIGRRGGWHTQAISPQYQKCYLDLVLWYWDEYGNPSGTRYKKSFGQIKSLLGLQSRMKIANSPPLVHKYCCTATFYLSAQPQVFSNSEASMLSRMTENDGKRGEETRSLWSTPACLS